LSGEITFKIGDTVRSAGPVPASTGAEAGRVLFLYTPGGARRLFEEMVERPVDPMNQEKFGPVALHGWEIVGPPPF
jgi:hypothetical protein